MNKNVPLTLVGEVTSRTVIYKYESHKLHQAFCVKGDNTILKSMPVALDEEGNIFPYTGAEGEVYLGIAVTDNINPAYQATRNYPVEVTVMMEGYAICNYVSNGEVPCGYVQVTGNTVNNHFIQVTASDSETKFINLTPATEENEVITVLIR